MAKEVVVFYDEICGLCQIFVGLLLRLVGPTRIQLRSL